MHKIPSFIVLIILFLATSSCAQQEQLNYLALGDSYTIGESVPEDLRWPVQLVDQLQKGEFKIAAPTIIAKTGWTTDELQDAIKEENLTADFDLVSLLIGVNNQYRGYPINQYKREFKELLEQAISFAKDDPNRVFVVSIPNYGVTPFGMEKGEQKIRRELLTYDSIADSIASEYGVSFLNITPISEKAKNDPSYIADDQLHPSGKQYSEWVDLILPKIKSMLKLYSKK